MRLFSTDSLPAVKEEKLFMKTSQQQKKKKNRFSEQ
jgi:hypothetical protein